FELVGVLGFGVGTDFLWHEIYGLR
ncbi:MAG: hypothetical protein ACJA1W_002713, partial [Akkermansiaceae bacterium]